MGNKKVPEMNHTEEVIPPSEEISRKRVEYTKFFKNYPPVGLIEPPEWPPRPEIFDEVKLGPFVSETDARIAYYIWSLPD